MISPLGRPAAFRNHGASSAEVRYRSPDVAAGAPPARQSACNRIPPAVMVWGAKSGNEKGARNRDRRSHTTSHPPLTRTREVARWHRPYGHWPSVSSGKLVVVTRGGSSRCWCFSPCPRSSSTATWAAFQGNHYEFGPYLSPFYSPLLFGASPHAWFGPQPGWWPGALPFSAALLDPLGPRRLQGHLLLLPRCLLQGVLGRSAVLHSRRTAEALSAASDRSRWSCRTSTGTSSISA